MSAFDNEADRVVAEMMTIGAELYITPAGRNTPPVWYYSGRAGTREALRRYRATIDIDRPEFAEAMCRAIERAKMSEVR